jgi:hypothetical protein
VPLAIDFVVSVRVVSALHMKTATFWGNPLPLLLGDPCEGRGTSLTVDLSGLQKFQRSEMCENSEITARFLQQRFSPLRF